MSPRDFQSACEAEYSVCDIDVSLSTDHCNVTAAYIQECSRHGIDIALPDECCKFRYVVVTLTNAMGNFTEGSPSFPRSDYYFSFLAAIQFLLN